MSNNTTLNPGAGGDVIATRDNGSGTKFPETLICVGAAGSENPVDSTHPLPVQLLTASGAAETAGSGISQPSGGVGLLGFLSGCYKFLSQLIFGAASELIVNGGGTHYTSVAAAASAAALSTSPVPKRLCKVVVIATGTVAVTLSDSQTTASSTPVLLTIPANAATGTVYVLDIPVATGIWVGSTTNTPALLVTWM